MKGPRNSVGKKTLSGYSFALFSAGLVAVLILAPTLLAGINVWSLLASVSDSLGGGASTTLFFMPYGNDVLSPGDTTSIDINFNSKLPINALGATITYSSSTLDIVGISKQRSLFDLWTEDTSISEDSGEIHFSGGTTLQGGLTGTGTILTITVKAKNSGKATLSFSGVQVYPSDGTGKPIITTTRSISYSVPESSAGVISSGAASVGLQTANPDLNGDGIVNLVDVSILVVKMMGGYNPRYDLNQDGYINLGDLSALLSKMGPH